MKFRFIQDELPEDVSLSVRRAWIEILRVSQSMSANFASLSVRRAWIEIWLPEHVLRELFVALREESVD